MTEQQKIEFLQNAISVLFNKQMTLNPEQVLTELSLDSLDIVELQMFYEEQTGQEIPDGDVPRTVADLLKIM